MKTPSSLKKYFIKTKIKKTKKSKTIQKTKTHPPQPTITKTNMVQITQTLHTVQPIEHQSLQTQVMPSIQQQSTNNQFHSSSLSVQLVEQIRLLQQNAQSLIARAHQIFQQAHQTFNSLQQISPRSNFDSSQDPYLKITNLTQSTPNEQLMYTCTRFGVMGSKTSNTSEIVFGKVLSSDYHISSTTIDIPCPVSDKYIKEMHCKIVTKNALNKQYDDFCKKHFLIFLKFNRSLDQPLPNSCIDLIYKFQRTQTSLFLQDLGSVHGTFIKLIPFQEYEIKQKQIYQFYNEVYFVIKSSKTIFTQTTDQQMFRNLALIESFPDDNWQIHWESDLDFLNYQQYKEALQDMLIEPENINEVLQNINRPYLFLEFSQQSQVEYRNHLFITTSQERATRIKKKFWIGKQFVCDISIPNSFLCNQQATISFNKKWCISDQNDTNNPGTWLNILQDGEVGYSERHELRDKQKIKIGECVFMLEFNNFNTQKKLNETRANVLRECLIN